MKTSASAIGSYIQLDWHSLRRRRPLCLRMREYSWKGPTSRFWSVQTEAARVRGAGDYHLNIQEGACYWPASEINRPRLLLGQQERRKHHRDQRPQMEKLGHFVFSTSQLRSGQHIAFGRQLQFACACGR